MQGEFGVPLLSDQGASRGDGEAGLPRSGQFVQPLSAPPRQAQAHTDGVGGSRPPLETRQVWLALWRGYRGPVAARRNSRRILLVVVVVVGLLGVVVVRGVDGGRGAGAGVERAINVRMMDLG